MTSAILSQPASTPVPTSHQPNEAQPRPGMLLSPGAGAPRLRALDLRSPRVVDYSLQRFLAEANGELAREHVACSDDDMAYLHARLAAHFGLKASPGAQFRLDR